MKKLNRWVLLIGLCMVTVSATMLMPSALFATTVVQAQAKPFVLTSTSLDANGVFKAEQISSGFGCTGGNLSPALSWSGAPDDTKSFGLSVYDLDAPTGSGFWHWVVFNIPASVNSLPAGAGDPSKKLTPEGTVQSRNDAGMPGYLGPCPPQGDKPHRYLITLFALKTDKLPLDEMASGALVGFYLNGSTIAKTTVTALYGQTGAFKLTSMSLDANGVFKREQVSSGIGCTGGNLSPALSWSGTPDDTKSFGLSVYDLDAPTGSGFWHWVVFNIPASVNSLPVGAGDPSKKLTPEGTIQSRNDAGMPGYLGPCPPQGDKPHRYLITLFALKTDKLPLDEMAFGALVGFYLNSSALDRATLIAAYGQ